MLEGFARRCYRHRRLVVLAWIAGLVALVTSAGSLGNAFEQSFQLSGTESTRAHELLKERFPAFSGDQGQIVIAVDEKGDVLARCALIERLVAEATKVGGVTAVVSPCRPEGQSQVSPRGDIAYISVQLADPAHEVPERVKDRFYELVRTERTPGVDVELGGRAFLVIPGAGSSEIIGLLAAVVILLVSFGSLLAMGLPILIALFGIGTGVATIELLSHLMEIPDFTTNIAMMIGIGVGVDYALFIVTRYRQGLHEGLDPEHSVVVAIDAAGRAVLFAGITVVISLLGLFLMGLGFARGLAIGTSATVGLVMIASVTLLPAVLGFVGHSIDRFAVPGLHRSERRCGERSREFHDPARLRLALEGLRRRVQRAAHGRGRAPLREGHRGAGATQDRARSATRRREHQPVSRQCAG